MVDQREESLVSKLKKAISLETIFGPYMVDELLGEGGAGRVFGGVSSEGAKVAIKVLSSDRVTTDKRRRFKNEISFLARNRHPNIVSVIDHGIATQNDASGPFYVMKRYDANLREVMRAGLPAQDFLPLFAKILDGVEAAHLQGAIHRDLKPENILFDRPSKTPLVADFGVASFTDDIVATAVETGPTQRLANFMYAAPEQRTPGKQVGPQADVYALGLMLNEIFTSNVPHGTEYQKIGQSNSQFAFLDTIVARMIRQTPNERYPTILDVKGAIASHQAEFLTLQRLSEFEKTVVPTSEVDDPLAHTPPKIVSADWNGGTLQIVLDRPVHQKWVQALHNMGSYSSLMGLEPGRFQFNQNLVRVSVDAGSAQGAIDHFKQWLPIASRVLKQTLELEARSREAKFREELRRAKQAEEERLRVTQNLRI
jgi:serine/threonine protein kinase